MLTFLLGGARSGKSALAVEIGRRHGGPVSFIATCPDIDGDDDLRSRIARHQDDRPAGWTTVEEELDLAEAISGCPNEALIIVDCLTTWVANVLHHGESERAVLARIEAALEACRKRAGDMVVVSNEVGLGIVPELELVRSYRDLLGRVNQRVAGRADRSLLLIAGRAVPLADPWELL